MTLLAQAAQIADLRFKSDMPAVADILCPFNILSHDLVLSDQGLPTLLFSRRFIFEEIMDYYSMNF